MSPSRESCQVYLSAESEKAALLVKYENAKAIMAKARKLYNDVVFGKVDPKDKTKRDVSLSDLYHSAEKAANDVAHNVVGDSSKSGKDLLKIIFLQILKLLLSTPEALFSFVFIPKDMAESYSNNEKKHLLRAKNDIDHISDVITRWSSVAVDDNLYYDIIKRALPYIKDALDVAHQVSVDLNNTENTSFQNSLAFDEGKYDRIKNDIAQAQDILKTATNAQTPIDIATVVKRDSDNIYKKLSDPIKEKYKSDKETLTSRYVRNLEQISNSEGVSDFDVRQKYTNDLKRLDDNLSVKLEEARIRSVKEATSGSGSNYRRLLKESGNEFEYDVQVLNSHLLGLPLNLQTAYTHYTNKQIMCSVLYNMDGMLKNLVNEVLNQLKPKPMPIDDVTGAENYLSIAHDKATDAIDKFNKSDKEISPSQMVETKFAVNTFLNLANNALNVTMNGKLRKLLDTVLILRDASGSYNQFLINLANIPDWDGASNVWAVKPSYAAPPYIQATANSLDVVVKAPFTFNTNNKVKRNTVGTLMSDIKSAINKHLSHNSYVDNVLYSYNPKSYPELNELISMLSKSGLMKVFSENISVLSIIAAIKGNTTTREFGTSWPSMDSCKIYPELYTDPNLSMSAVKNTLDMPAYGTNNSTMDWLVSTALKTNALRQDVRSFTMD
jgi:predicted DNA binding CopG/RHH family protein